jgi:hypothetical protein
MLIQIIMYSSQSFNNDVIYRVIMANVQYETEINAPVERVFEYQMTILI